MKKEDLSPGDVCYLPHDTRFKYTYLGPYAGNRINVGYHIDDSNIGVFAYNEPGTKEFKTVNLPFAAVEKE